MLRKNINLILLLLFCLLQVNCRNNSDSNVNTIFPLEQSVQIVDINKHINSLEFINLEETPNSLMSYVEKILIDNNGNLIILDGRGGVMTFDSKGFFKKKIGRKGKGPGEYIRLDDICISENGEYLFILQLGSIIKYSLIDNTYLSTIKIPKINFDAISVSGSGGFYLFSANPGEPTSNDEDFTLIEIDGNGKKIKELLPKKDFGMTQDIITQSYDKSYILRPICSNHIIYSMKNGEVTPIYKLDFKEKNIPPKFILNYGDDLAISMKEYFNSKYYKFPYQIHDTKDLLYFATIGPSGKEVDFLFSKNLKKGINWIEKETDREPLRILASDEDYFYAVLQPEMIDNYKKNPTNNFNILKNLLLNKCPMMSNNNPVLVKVKFIL